MRNTIRLWLATRVSTVGAAASMAIVGFNTLSPNTSCPAIVPASKSNDSWRTESVLIFCRGIDAGVAGREGRLYGYQVFFVLRGYTPAYMAVSTGKSSTTRAPSGDRFSAW